MDACYTAVIALLCSLLHAVKAQGSTLGVEAWAAIGLIGSIVALIIGLIWIVFCVMLYRHNKERRGSDEDSNEEKERQDKQQRKKEQKQRREQLNQRREIESGIQNSEALGVHNLPLEDGDQENGSSTLQAPGTTSPQVESPSAPAESAQQTEETNTTEPPDDNPSLLSPPPPSESPKPSESVPSIFQSLFSPPALRLDGQGGGECDSGSHTGRKLHPQLPQANVSSSRLRQLSDVEECDVQPEPSNFPLRYGQRRPSNASRKISESSDPFSFFNFEALPLGRSPLENRDTQYHGGPTKIEISRNLRISQDHMFGQLSSWPEFD